MIGSLQRDSVLGFYRPLFPILLAVYYSNQAQTAQAPLNQMPSGSVGPPPTFQAGVRLCPTCGTRNTSTAFFCTKCGARLWPHPRL